MDKLAIKITTKLDDEKILRNKIYNIIPLYFISFLIDFFIMFSCNFES